MKKLSVLLCAMVFIFPFTACADNKPIDVSQLPAPAREFIALHFKDAKVSLSTVDRELFDTTYDVFFADGGNVEFDRKGQWKSVESKTGSVPEAIIPEAIRNYIVSNHPERFVREISRDRRDWEVELDNGLDLKFDTRFRLIEIDS